MIICEESIEIKMHIIIISVILNFIKNKNKIIFLYKHDKWTYM